MKVFISGGSKSGKSNYAQNIAAALKKDKLYYIATMKASDKEDRLRIEKHIEDRQGLGFETIEQFRDIEEILGKADKSGVFLIDSLTALMANEMFSASCINACACDKIIMGLKVIFEKTRDCVIVSDYIYSDASSYDEITENYRRNLALVDKFCAKNCDIVLESVYSQLFVHKGEKEFSFINEKIG